MNISNCKQLSGTKVPLYFFFPKELILFPTCMINSDIKFLHDFIFWKHDKIFQITQDENSEDVAKEFEMSRSRISEIPSNSQSIERILTWPNYRCIWKLQHWIIWRLINECNLVSVDNTKCIVQEHRLESFIEMKKPALNKKRLKAKY